MKFIGRQFNVDPADRVEFVRGVDIDLTGIFAYEDVGLLDDEHARGRAVVEVETIGTVEEMFAIGIGLVQGIVVPTQTFEVNVRRRLTEMVDEGVGFVDDGQIP